MSPPWTCSGRPTPGSASASSRSSRSRRDERRPISSVCKRTVARSSRATRCRARFMWSTRSRARRRARPTTRGRAASSAPSAYSTLGAGITLLDRCNELVGDAERRAAVALLAHEVEMRLGREVARRAVSAEEILDLGTGAQNFGSLWRDVQREELPITGRGAVTPVPLDHGFGRDELEHRPDRIYRVLRV